MTRKHKIIQSAKIGYPLGYKYHKLCPTARYVGGTSVYLCECQDKAACPAQVQRTLDEDDRPNDDQSS